MVGWLLVCLHFWLSSPVVVVAREGGGQRARGEGQGEGCSGVKSARFLSSRFASSVKFALTRTSTCRRRRRRRRRGRGRGRGRESILFAPRRMPITDAAARVTPNLRGICHPRTSPVSSNPLPTPRGSPFRTEIPLLPRSESRAPACFAAGGARAVRRCDFCPLPSGKSARCVLGKGGRP